MTYDVSDWPAKRGGKKPESEIRGKVVAALKPLRAFAVENLCDEGTPDIALTTGWIEVKRADAWPVRESTPLRLRHFTPAQRVFLREWCRAGGRAWAYLAVGTEAFLFNGTWAADHLGIDATREHIVVAAAVLFPHGLEPARLLEACR